MVEITVHEASGQLSQLLQQVAAGEAVIISEAGQPVARLIPFTAARPARPLGLDRGLFTVPDDFNAPLPEELLAAFEGRG